MLVRKHSNARQVDNDGLGDWRIQAATRLAADVPSAYPGGPSHKAGTGAYLTTRIETSKYPNFNFVTPSATALAMGAAIRSAKRATDLRAKIAFVDAVTPQGHGTSLRFENLTGLYDYFQEAMACSHASFQAIEAFANEMIGRHLKEPISLERRKGLETFDSAQL